MYLVAIGYDVPTLDCAAIDPQPSSQGVRYTKRTYAGDGTIYDEGAYVELEFSALGNAADYQALLDQFNVLSYSSAAVTVVVRSQILTSTRYNGTAVQPQLGQDLKWSYFPRNVTILIKNLIQLVEA